MKFLPRGYCVSPNNITATPGVFIYAAGPGIPEPKFSEINLREDGSIAVGTYVVIGTHYSPEAKLVFSIGREFSNADEFLAYYEEHGALSEPGVPPGSCGVWDGNYIHNYLD